MNILCFLSLCWGPVPYCFFVVIIANYRNAHMKKFLMVSSKCSLKSSSTALMVNISYKSVYRVLMTYCTNLLPHSFPLAASLFLGFGIGNPWLLIRYAVCTVTLLAFDSAGFCFSYSVIMKDFYFICSKSSLQYL